MITQQTFKNKDLIKYVLITVGIGSIIAIGIFYFINQGKYETTDNAQLDGDILSIRSGVTAYIDAIDFTDNQHVHKGDTLIRFNTTVLLAHVVQARAAVTNAKAAIKVNISKASSGAENASASLQMARSNQEATNVAAASMKQAEQEYGRTQKLFSIKGATQQQLIAAQTQVTIANAQYQESLSKRQSSLATAKGQSASAQSDKAQISTTEALVEQRNAELIIAEDELHRAYVLAPCDGIVTKRAVQSGQYVSTGQSLCAVINDQHLWVSANVKETQLASIREGQEVEIKVDAYPNLMLKGKVASFEGATGAKFSLLPPDNASGNFVKVVQRFPIKISLRPLTANDRAKTPLYPGLSAFVKIKTN